MALYDAFIKAINEKKIVKVKVDSVEKGVIVRNCIPFDFGPSRLFNDGQNRFHFQDLDSPDGAHNLSVLPEQLLQLEITDKLFEPGDYVTWTPRWHVGRDWGIFS